MEIKVTATEKPTHNQEHTVQVQMINLLAKAITEEKPRNEIVKIIDQLLKFSQVHFMSEQLIMRQHSYDGFDEHENEHGELIDQLEEVKQKILSDEIHLDQHKFNQLRGNLLNHIATQDQKLAGFLCRPKSGNL